MVAMAPGGAAMAQSSTGTTSMSSLPKFPMVSDAADDWRADG